MPEQGTKRQENDFERLKKYLLIDKRYEYRGYIQSEDYYRFGKPIRCYIKFISIKARSLPKESLRVLVEKNRENEIMQGIKICDSDFWGKGSVSVFVIPGDEKSYNLALELIDTI
ncbi:MAG: hypothetical protein NTZ18_04515 [Candidatus Komeilibacteria bacterium]|nr:hypothetical protein [Candidatus Komeilibacteria bacterium]